MWERRRREELADKLCCCSSVFGGASAILITWDIFPYKSNFLLSYCYYIVLILVILQLCSRNQEVELGVVGLWLCPGWHYSWQPTRIRKAKLPKFSTPLAHTLVVRHLFFALHKGQSSWELQVASFIGLPHSTTKQNTTLQESIRVLVGYTTHLTVMSLEFQYCCIRTECKTAFLVFSLIILNFVAVQEAPNV